MRYLYLIAFTTLIACSTSDKPKSTDALDQYFEKHIPANEPGGAVLIMRDDSIVFAKGYGVADITTAEPITTKTLFNLGSISKTFVANAILILQQEGKLSLEDSILQYFPDFKIKSIAEKVRIKHLLTHTSGLPDNRRIAEDSVFFLTANDEQNWYPVTQCERLIFEPGLRYEYSNPAYNGLALIVEKVSGMKWQKFIEERIFRPSGMTTSTITDGSHPTAGVSHGYVLNHGQWTEDDYGEEPTFPAAGNGGVWSSVDELVKYERALRDSVFLPDSVIQDSRTAKVFPGWSDSRKLTRGWSWSVEKNELGKTVVGHTGSQGGFLCNYVSIPADNVFFVILCNTPRDVSGFSSEIMRWLYEAK